MYLIKETKSNDLVLCESYKIKDNSIYCYNGKTLKTGYFVKNAYFPKTGAYLGLIDVCKIVKINNTGVVKILYAQP